MIKYLKLRRLFFMSLLLSTLCTVAGCSIDFGPVNSGTKPVNPTTPVEPTTPITAPTQENSIDLTLFANCNTIRFSSFLTGSEKSETIYLKQEAPYDDNYEIKTNSYTNYDLFDKDGKKLFSLKPGKKTSINLQANEIVYGVASTTPGKKIGFDITLKEHYSLLPYDPINLVDGQALLNDSKKLQTKFEPAEISYKKREGGLYINCNNPEKLTDDCIDKALTRHDISNKEVFFTFEHNNSISTSFIYGYQVMNKGTEDMYVTVKNIGLQLDGAGCWLGEREWTDFYNTEFRMKNYDKYTTSQLNNLYAYFGFCNTYKAPNRQPITYRVPAGKHIYVMGGTTADSYEKINVFNTANKTIQGGCSNGAVLFEVIGDNVEGCFYVYKDHRNIQSDNTTHQGYVVNHNGHDYGSQYVGLDYCHGVVDVNLTWEFNDNVSSQYLPVQFTNYYADYIPQPGVPYGKINSTAHLQKNTKWTTHINPQANHNAVGTDMTKYHTVNSDGEAICIDSDHYDGKGNTANIGNWMIDYMENYTFVNHGNKDRNVTISFKNNGSIAVLLRDQNGKIIPNTAQYTINVAASTYGDAISDPFEYTITIPANSYIQFTVEYNLLANSYGNIEHKVWLK